MSSPPLPTRVAHIGLARERFGTRVDRLVAYLASADPAADAAAEALAALPPAARTRIVDEALALGIAAVPDAPPAVVALFAELDRVPFWVDFDRADRGGLTFVRAGWFGGLVLALQSLIAGYCSAGGNKPLAFSGRLKESAPRRLAETSRFVQAVSLPGGMRRHGEGFAITVKVRLMHAQVRRMLLGSPDWAADAWGVPINQVDMAGTVLLFSFAVLQGFRKLGVGPSAHDSEDFLHLWRYVGHVLGVDASLLCASEAEAEALWDVIEAIQGEPDKDSRDLAAALIEASRTQAKTTEERLRADRLVSFAYGLSRYLIGDRYADFLGYPKSSWVKVIPLVRPAMGLATTVAQRTALGRRLAALAGIQYWSSVVNVSLGGKPATFAMPERLAAE